jgi:hypothetical protein
LYDGENSEKVLTGMGQLPEGDVKKAPKSEGSLFVGETERNFVFGII